MPKEPSRGFLDELSGALSSARGLLSSSLELFTLEARRAGLALAAMLACGLLGAILVFAAWLGLLFPATRRQLSRPPLKVV